MKEDAQKMQTVCLLKFAEMNNANINASMIVFAQETEKDALRAAVSL